MSRAKFVLSGLACLALVGAAAFAWLVQPYRGNLSHYPAGRRLFDRKGTLVCARLGPGDILCEPITIDRAGDWVVKALVSAEDKRFHRHPGVDALAVVRAAAQNIAAGRVVSGASTITTMVIKLTHPRPRTFMAKVVEARHALALERILSKAQILEQYLNRAPFGGNVCGIESAARRYFNKPAADLTLSESAMLVGLPQAPSRLRPDRHFEAALRRRDYVLGRMLACGAITAEQHAAAVADRPRIQSGVLPRPAPNFCDMVLERTPPSPRLRTTLDSAIQADAQSALERKLSELAPRDVQAGAIVVLDIRASAVRAMACAAARSDVPGACVNFALARRSPGSSLKPFLYAFALEQGLCTPRGILADVPVDIGGYEPRNFDQAYAGPVTVRRALVESLNVPAIRMAREVGLATVLLRLREMGFTTLNKAPELYGISLAVGTCEVTLLDLAGAYSVLARRGLHAPLRIAESDPRPGPRRLVSEEACYLVSDMLSGGERALSISGHSAETRAPRVALKTGTSNGYRDAVAVAWNPEFVVAAWFGNPDGHSSGALLGIEAAAPAVYEVFRRLYPSGDSPWFERPPGIRTRQVCALSGAPPNGLCPATVADDFIPGVSRCDACSVHCPAGDGSRDVAEAWPAEIQAFLASCQAGAGSSGEAASAASVRLLRITSPAHRQTLRMLGELPGLRQEIKLSAQGGAASGTIYWFVDSELLGAVGPGRPIYWPLRRGRHAIACADAEGQYDRVDIAVE